MSNPNVVAAFASADLTGLPPFASVREERGQLLWVLHAGNDRLKLSTMTAGEIAAVLRDILGIMVPWQRIEATLSKEKGTVAVRRRGRDKRRAYQIMQEGVQVVVSTSQVAVFVDPTQALTKVRQVESILVDLRGIVRVCDPYVDGRTLDVLAECTGAMEIRLLTCTINRPGPFKRDLQLFRQQHNVPMDVRSVGPGLLHDRYAIYDGGMVLFGTSLNSIGRKQSFIVVLGEDLRSSVLAAFEGHWIGAGAV